MSNDYFISDLHLGHKNVIKFEDGYRAKAMGVSTIEEHDEMIMDLWNERACENDTVYVLGDLGKNFEVLKSLPGKKILHLGNHDRKTARAYLEVFDDIVGPIRFSKHWLAHFPPIEGELWGKDVIHGHTHNKGVEDPRYINVCVEMTGGKLVPYQEIASGRYTTHDRVNKPFEFSPL
jgi:calcineurin-like phosphoesterase family protein